MRIVFAIAGFAELKLLVGNALKTVMDEVGPQFEKASGNTLSVTVGKRPHRRR